MLEDEAYAHQHVAVSPGRYVMLAVSDHGCGMDAETLRHIFEPFYTTKHHAEGTGLGLSTVYGVVKQSGGYIWVYSEVSRGTTFKIYLPQVNEVADARKSETVSTAVEGGTETVLLAEDEKLVRKFVRSILEKNGYTVLEAHHGWEALRAALQHPGPIHLLLTDRYGDASDGRETPGSTNGGFAARHQGPVHVRLQVKMPWFTTASWNPERPLLKSVLPWRL